MADFASDRFTIGFVTLDAVGVTSINLGFRPVHVEVNADYHQAPYNSEYYSSESSGGEANTMSISIGYGGEDKQIVTAFAYYSGSSNQHQTYEGDDAIIYLIVLNSNENGYSGHVKAELSGFTDTGFDINVTELYTPISFTYKAF